MYSTKFTPLLSEGGYNLLEIFAKVKDNAPIQTLLTGVSDMIPVISFVGSSNSGKTTLVEQVIKILSDKGIRISLIKHDAHGFEIDHEGKDTWRHKKAGAVRVLISSPAKYAMIADGEADLGDMLYMAGDGDIDLIVIEGYKSSSLPKIEVFREANGKKPVCTGHESLLAVATDTPESEQLKSAPMLLDINDPQAVVRFIEERILCEEKPFPFVSLVADGKKIDLNRFASFSLANTLKGYLKSLKGAEDAVEFEIKISMKK